MAFLTPVVIKLGNVQWYYVRFLHTKLYPKSVEKPYSWVKFHHTGREISRQDAALYGIQLMCCGESKEIHRTAVIWCVKREFANIEE